MNKTELIKKVSERSNIDQSDVRKVINSFTDVISESLVMGINVKIPNFANFTLEVCKEKKAYNPITEEYYTIPKRYKVKVKLPRKLTDQVGNKPVY